MGEKYYIILNHELGYSYLHLSVPKLFKCYTDALEYVRKNLSFNSNFRIGVFDDYFVDSYYDLMSQQDDHFVNYVPLIRKEHEVLTEINMYGTTIEVAPENAIRHAIIWTNIRNEERQPLLDYNLNDYIDMLNNGQDVFEMNLSSYINWIKILQQMPDLHCKNKRDIFTRKIGLEYTLEKATKMFNKYGDKGERRFKSNELPYLRVSLK